MKRCVGVFLGVLLVGALGCASVSAAAQPPKRRPMIVEFWAAWCGPCLMLDEITFADSRVRAALTRFEIRRVNASVASAEVDRLAALYGVEQLPSLVFVDSKGQILQEPRVASFVPPDELLRILLRVQ